MKAILKDQIINIMQIIDADDRNVHFETGQMLNKYRTAILQMVKEGDKKVMTNLVAPLTIETPDQNEHGGEYTVDRTKALILCTQLLSIINGTGKQ